MPGWKDVVTDEELWALAYYVDYLREFKQDVTKREAFLSKTQE